MYAMYYNRFTGWLWFALGAWGLFHGPVGDYLQLTHLEVGIAIAVGCLGMLGTRLLRRNQVIVCAILSVIYAVWIATGSNPLLTSWISSTPLESVLRFLCTAWGIYCVIIELWQWRARALPPL